MRTATSPRPDLWGIGQFQVGDERIAYPLSQDDVQRDVAGATKVLASLGIGAGAKVVLVSLLSEAAHTWPVQVGLLAVGAQLSCADATRADAFRVAMFLRARTYDAVIGVDRAVVESLREQGRAPGDLFGDLSVVAARPGAHELLTAAGVEARRWLHLGPALAVECDRHAGAHVDGDEWALAVDDGEVLVTARRSRAAAIDRQPTGLRGRVVDDPCACGRDDPRIVPTVSSTDPGEQP